jgi:hypothetical protein
MTDWAAKSHQPFAAAGASFQALRIFQDIPYLFFTQAELFILPPSFEQAPEHYFCLPDLGRNSRPQLSRAHIAVLKSYFRMCYPESREEARFFGRDAPLDIMVES